MSQLDQWWCPIVALNFFNKVHFSQFDLRLLLGIEIEIASQNWTGNVDIADAATNDTSDMLKRTKLEDELL